MTNLSAMVIVIDKEEVKNVPENLEDFFDKFPSIGGANLELTDQEHYPPPLCQ